MIQQNKLIERKFFDEYATHKEYDVLSAHTYLRLLKKLDLIRDKFSTWQVDLGCGTGAFTKYILTEPYKTIALDLSFKSLRRVNSQIREVSPVQGDIERLPFASDSIDLLIFSGVLHHFPELTRVVSESYRVLKPGGHGFAFDPNEFSPLMWLFRSRKSPVSNNRGRTQNERNLTSRELETVFEGAGFVHVQVAPISGILYRHVAGQNRFVLTLYNFFELVLEITRLERLIGSFLLMTFQKSA